MLRDLILAFGLLAVIEGLVLALAPLRFEELLKVLQSMDPSKVKYLGLLIIFGGTVLIWIAQHI